MLTNKTAELLYSQMVIADEREVAGLSAVIFNAIQKYKTHNQILGLAAIFILMLEHYDLNYSEALGIAHSIVHGTTTEKATKQFAAIKQFMRDEWAIRFKGR